MSWYQCEYDGKNKNRQRNKKNIIQKEKKQRYIEIKEGTKKEKKKRKKETKKPKKERKKKITKRLSHLLEYSGKIINN